MEDLHKIVMNLSQRVDKLEEKMDRQDKRPDVLFKEEWLDGQDVQLALNISERTLQTLRSGKILIPTQIRGKFFYKLSDIKALMEMNYIRNHLSHKK